MQFDIYTQQQSSVFSVSKTFDRNEKDGGWNGVNILCNKFTEFCLFQFL